MTFEWDERKNRINQRKHGISFERAARVWLDMKRIVRFDFEHSQSEERWIVIGEAEVLLLVVYVEKGENAIRLISARRASGNEKREYYENYNAR